MMTPLVIEQSVAAADAVGADGKTESRRAIRDGGGAARHARAALANYATEAYGRANGGVGALNVRIAARGRAEVQPLPDEHEPHMDNVIDTECICQ